VKEREGLLAGKVALITGASRGIGKATALIFAENGAKLAIHGRDQVLLENLAGEIRKRKNDCLIVKGDLTLPDIPHMIIKKTVQHFGEINILVNNAGIIRREKFEEMTLEQWEEVLKVNLTAVMKCCQEVLPYMKEKNFGKIVNVSSNAAKRSYLGAALSYGASKAALLNLTRNLAKAYAPFGIYINAICPGQTETEMCTDWSLEFRLQQTEQIPLGRLGKPEEIGKAILFLCSDLSNFVVGETLVVNGGSFMD